MMAVAAQLLQISSRHPAIRSFHSLNKHDVAIAGGKGANLGELASMGLPTPPGFVLCADAWREVRTANDLDASLALTFAGLDHTDHDDLQSRCAQAMRDVDNARFPASLEESIRDAWSQLTASGNGGTRVIVRSSATLEDTAEASCAGMHRTFPNVRDADHTLEAIRGCWASLFAPRSVFYRAERGYDVADADIAVVVQRYIPAIKAGVMFTAEPATGDPDRIVIEAALGGGESVVAGRVTPDRYVVSRHPLHIVSRDIRVKQRRTVDDELGGTLEQEIPLEDGRRSSLDDLQVLEIARVGARIDMHYETPQDIEWLMDLDSRLWIVQSRPVTGIHMPSSPADAPRLMPGSQSGQLRVRGMGAAGGVASGPVRILQDPTEADRLRPGDVLVAHMTAPDWTPLMRRAAAIVTDAGGVTCHAAIVAREIGIPCVVGTGTATTVLHEDEVITVDGSAGTVSEGAINEPGTAVPTRASQLEETPERLQPTGTQPQPTATDILVNLSDPATATSVAACDCDGVGLIRAEQMIVEALGGVHPLELIAQGTSDTAVQQLAVAIRTFIDAFAPRPVTYRTIDFRTSEFRHLTGGSSYEPIEANPMIGFRGAGRYAEQPALLELEAQALRDVVAHGAPSLRIMLPFVRTPRDVTRCITILQNAGVPIIDEVPLWIMAEVPSVMWHLPAYRQLGVAGISIGTNDLAQLLLGADRDSELLARYSATDTAVVDYLTDLIAAAHMQGLDTSICGQAPSIYPEYADILVGAGIGSISVTPDALEQTHRHVRRAEMRLLLDASLQTRREWGRWDSNPRPTD
jgi:pyruvate,water dikinase